MLSERYFGVAKEIYKIIENENALDVNGNLSLIKEKLNYLISNLRLSSSYAKVQNSYGKVISSVGNEEIFEKSEKIEETALSNKNIVNVEETPKEQIKKKYQHKQHKKRKLYQIKKLQLF